MAREPGEEWTLWAIEHQPDHVGAVLAAQAQVVLLAEELLTTDRVRMGFFASLDAAVAEVRRLGA